MLNKTVFFRVFGIGLCITLGACDSPRSKDQQSADAQGSSSVIVEPSALHNENPNTGKKLTDIAGQATLPAAASELQDLDQQTDRLPMEAESFVGRYHTQISCEDHFVTCEQGSAEFIINLLADGTAHRTVVYMGKITSENTGLKSNRSYQKNTWRYDHVNHEIVVDRVEGIQFFYKVDAENNLVIDSDRILNSSPENKRYFSQNHPLPAKAYVLKKFNN